MRLARRIAALVVLAAGVLATDAHAYPEFQLSTGATSCSDCHYSPAGGGLLNDWGRDEAASTIAEGGDGRFLHGALTLPEPLALGGDVRMAALHQRVRDGRENAVFPMQADLYARVAAGSWSLSATAGVLARLRGDDAVWDNLGSREHFLQYQSDEAWYARAGRFYPIVGLRVPDHTAFIRRFTGLYLLEEDYGVAAGLARGPNHWHASIATPLELHPRVGSRGWGGALQWERLIADDTASVSLGARGRRTSSSIQGWLTATAKWWLEAPNLMWMAELDVGGSDTPGGTRARIAGLGSLLWRPAGRYGLAVTAHYFDPSVRFLGQERLALDLSGRWFWKGHLEVAALIRGESVASDNAQLLTMLQLHYFL